MFCRVAILLAPVLLFLTGCASPRYVYHYVPGRTATLSDGYASAPPAAPPQVHMAVAAANRIAGSAYGRGGGHTRGESSAYDCSGATSYVLQAAGLLDESMPSRAFRHYGKAGEGKWLSVLARNGHVFLVIAGLRFDTGWTGQSEGVKWTTRSRPARGHVIRHPPNL
jgi:hypothetical protein